MSPLSQPMNEFSPLNLLPLLQTDAINLVWKFTSELWEACTYIIRIQGGNGFVINLSKIWCILKTKSLIGFCFSKFFPELFMMF